MQKKMSKQACQKEILCTGKAILTLQNSVNQLQFLKGISEDNYKNNVDVNLKEIEANTLRSEKIIKQGNQITKTLMGE